MNDLLDSGVAVIGDVADLCPPPGGDDGDGPTAGEVAAAWTAAVPAGGKTTGP